MTMHKLSALFGVAAPDAAVIRVREQRPELASAYPEADPDYVFQPLLLKKLLRWIDGLSARRNVLLFGGAGVGKTSVVLEIAARLNIPVFNMACSGKTRFAHLVGSRELVGGETVWRDGPLTRAMRHGGIFLANEITRMDPGEQLDLADVLDGTSRLVVPDTGEVVLPDPQFRFAGTGNSAGFGDDTGAYVGEKESSFAFVDRFQKYEVLPLEEAEERKLLQRVAAHLTEDVRSFMLRFARESRTSFVGNGGGLRLALSTRSLIVWAQETEGYARIKGIDPMREALMDTLLNGTPQDEKATLLELYDRWLKAA